MKLHRVLPAVVGSIALLAIGAVSGAARNFSISNQGIRATWAQAQLEATVRCAVTIEGTLHARTHAKIGGLLIGRITRARIARPCIEGEAWFLTVAEGQAVESLPWHIRYNSFTGALPNVTSVTWQVVGMSWRVRTAFGITCLATSVAAEPVLLRLRLTAGTVTGVDLGGNIAWRDCVPAVTLSGAGNMTLLETTARITLTLI